MSDKEFFCAFSEISTGRSDPSAVVYQSPPKPVRLRGTNNEVALTQFVRMWDGDKESRTQVGCRAAFL